MVGDISDEQEDEWECDGEGTGEMDETVDRTGDSAEELVELVESTNGGRMMAGGDEAVDLDALARVTV